MAGLSLNMGLNGQGAFGSGFGSAAVPAQAQQPQGPTTVGQKAFGITSPGQASTLSAAHVALCGGGFASFALLAWLYWSLPR